MRERVLPDHPLARRLHRDEPHAQRVRRHLPQPRGRGKDEHLARGGVEGRPRRASRSPRPRPRGARARRCASRRRAPPACGRPLHGPRRGESARPRRHAILAHAQALASERLEEARRDHRRHAAFAHRRADAGCERRELLEPRAAVRAGEEVLLELLLLAGRQLAQPVGRASRNRSGGSYVIPAEAGTHAVGTRRRGPMSHSRSRASASGGSPRTFPAESPSSAPTSPAALSAKK